MKVHENLRGTPPLTKMKSKWNYKIWIMVINILGTRGLFRVRREFSVLAERHIFGCQPKPRAAEQKPKTALEVSGTQGGWLSTTRPIFARPARTDIANTYSRFRSLPYPTQKTGGLTHIWLYLSWQRSWLPFTPEWKFFVKLFCDKRQTPPTADDGRLYQLFVP